MGTQGVSGSSQILQHRQLAQTETVVHHQSHTHRHTIIAQDQRFDASDIPQLHIERIVVIARFVLVGEEGFPSILRSHDASLHLIAIGKLIPQPVTVFRSQVALVVALALIERHSARRNQLVMAVLGDVPETGHRLTVVGRLLLIDI